eukprot:g15510.t1
MAVNKAVHLSRFSINSIARYCVYPRTETNNELCAFIPGPGCPVDSGNEMAGPGEGFIHVHRGFHGVGDLAEAHYDWRNPVAEVFIAAK